MARWVSMTTGNVVEAEGELPRALYTPVEQKKAAPKSAPKRATKRMPKKEQ